MYEARIRVSKTVGVRLNSESREAAAIEARAAAARVATPGEDVEVISIVDKTSGTTIAHQSGLPPEGMLDVTWSVRIPATEAMEGACMARFMQFDPSSLAAVYHVRDATGSVQVIDLQDCAAAPH